MTVRRLSDLQKSKKFGVGRQKSSKGFGIWWHLNHELEDKEFNFGVHLGELNA